MTSVRRPQSHEIDTAGQRAFERMLPPIWVARRDDPDYGVDYVIEVFTEDGRPTGLRFGVQLKTTTTNSCEADAKVSIAIKDLDYWELQAIPVALVVLELNEGEPCAWVEWSNNLDPYPLKPEQESKTFTFTDHQRWEETTPGQLAEVAQAWFDYRRQAVTWPLGVRVRAPESSPSGNSLAHLERQLRTQLKDQRLLELRHDRTDPTDVVVSSDRREVRAATIGGGHSVLNLMGPLRSDWGRVSGSVLTYLIASALCNANQWRQAAEIIAAVRREPELLSRPAVAGNIVSILLIGERLADAEDVLRTLSVQGEPYDESVRSVAWASFHLRQTMGIEVDDRVLQGALESSFERAIGGDPPIAMATAYSLSNLLRSADPSESLAWLDRMRDIDPRVDEAGFWHKERGSCYWNLDDLEASAASFEDALERGDDDPTLPLLASDPLIALGNFERAIEVLEASDNLPASKGAEVALRLLACRAISDATNSSYFDVRDNVPGHTGALLTVIVDYDGPIEVLVAAAVWNIGHDEIWALALYKTITDGHGDLARSLAMCIREQQMSRAIELVDLFAELNGEPDVAQDAYRYYEDALIVRRAPISRAFGPSDSST